MDRSAAETSSRPPFTYASDTGLVSVWRQWKSYSWSVRVMLIPSSLSLNVKCCEVNLRYLCEVILFWSEVSYGEVLVDKSTMYIGWPYTESAWLYCNYLIWCVSCTVVVLTCFVMCGCFGNMCTCIYCILYRLYCVFVSFLLCIFILICFVCKV
jgi:hypothetical protein